VVVLSGIAGSILRVGDMAPDFDLPALVSGVKKRFRLSDCQGKKNVLLAFYPLNWDSVSAQQLREYQAERERFAALETMVVTVSVDSIMNNGAWERDIGPFDFVLCSDFWPHGDVSRKYGVFRTEEPQAGACERAIFVVDKAGKIQFSKIYEMGRVPDLGEVLGAFTKS
jgi:peroxiredoxin